MDAKITLSFNQDIADKAKQFAADNNISLSRLTEFLYKKITDGQYSDLEELPISDWVNMVAEGEVEYKRKNASNPKKEYYESRKK